MRARPFTKQHAYLDGKRHPEAEKLTPSMWMMMFDILLHADWYYSREKRGLGGALATQYALRARGIMDGLNRLTKKGEKLCEVDWRDAQTANVSSKKCKK